MRLPFRRSTVPETAAMQQQVDFFNWNLQEGSGLMGVPWSPRLADRVWVVNRCLQLTSQQLASMPLRFYGSFEPAWVANPDPIWFPNGLGDAVFAAAWSMYAYGDAFLYVTDRYATGFPASWTVLDAQQVNVQVENGEKTYRYREQVLVDDDIVQITRDPRGYVRGTSALAAYASLTWGMVGATELARSMVTGSGSIPNAVLKHKRKLTPPQAKAIQDSWVEARGRSQIGAPAVLDEGLDLQQLQFSAADLMLIDLQQYDARAIASAFSIPSFMLNMPLEGGLTYQNPESLFEVWWRTELRPAAGRIQRALSAQMLPRGSWVEFDARAALAPTFQNQVTSWLALLAAGVVTNDEARAALLHLPPLAAGEAIEDLTEPPSAAATPADGQGEPATVLEFLHPGMVSST